MFPNIVCCRLWPQKASVSGKVLNPLWINEDDCTFSHYLHVINISTYYAVPPYSFLTLFSPEDAFWRNSRSRRLLKTLWPKEKLLIKSNFSFNYRDFLFFDKICSKSSAAELLYEGKGSAIFYGDLSGFCHYVFDVIYC